MGKIGYSSITLTDLTETLPISLVLETNQEQNIQTKEGDFYTPNFNPKTGGEELIITPSLFLGSIEKEVPTNYISGSYIYYKTGEMEELENGSVREKQYYFYENNESEEIYVDRKGRLHYKKNLKENLTIEAYIVGFKNKIDQDYITSELVRAQNPITIFLLEQGKGIYTLVISSEGNREHFEENNSRDIILTATLYKGAEPIINGVEYKWDIVTDNDDGSGDDFEEKENTITIPRAQVNNTQVYQCTAIFNGLEFSSQKIIRDFTDGYTNQLIADKSLILTPNNTTVTLTNQVWYQANIINKDKYEGNNLTEEQIKENESNHNRFSYKWSLLTQDMEEIILFLGSGKEYKDYTIDLNSSFQKLDETGEVLVDDETGNPIEGNFPKENFSILGMVTIDGKTVTLNYADIKYQPVTYTVEISPKTIFVPATNSGAYRGEDNFIQKIKFQLLDDNKQPLKYDINDSGPTSLTNNNDKSSIEITRKDSSIWDFDIDFTLDTSSSNNLWGDINSKTYEFTYEYLGNIFTEEFEVVKNYAGINGNPGYTVDLSNNFHAFSGGEGRADLGQEVEIKFYAYYGDKGLDIQKVGLTSGSEEISNGTQVAKGLYIKRKNATDKVGERTYVLYTAESGDNFLTENGSIDFYITVKDGTDIKTFYKSFQYIINFNGKSYFLQFNENTIIYEVNTNYNPNQIVATAYYREVNGTTQKYEKGRIRYTTDGTNWKNGTGSVTIIMPNNLFINNINIELYSAQDTSWNEKYLLDKETIPILVSLEGAQVGGENLLRWTKDLPLEKNKWNTTFENISSIKEGDFNYFNFNIPKVLTTPGSPENENTNPPIRQWANVKSSKIFFEQDYLEKTFVFSFEVRLESLPSTTGEAFMGTFSPYLIFNENYEDTGRGRYGSIFSLNSDGTSSSNITFSEPFKEDKWIRLSYSFIMTRDRFANPDSGKELLSWDKCNYMSLYFYLSHHGKIQIRKPKLEMANVATSWSPSSYDINYEDVSGLNLISDSVALKIEQELNGDNFYELGYELSPNTFYTFAFSESSWERQGTTAKVENNFRIEIIEKTTNNKISFKFSDSFSSEDRTTKTFKTASSYNSIFRIYPISTELDKQVKGVLTLREVKLEKGENATPYTITDDFLNSAIEALSLNSVNTVTFEDFTGAYQTTISDLKNSINSLQKDYDIIIDEVDGKISTIATDITTAINNSEGNIYFKKLEGMVTIQSDVNEPYIEIATHAGSDEVAAIRITDERIEFREHNDTVASIQGSYLEIKKGIFKEDLKIGKLQVSITDSGVGFLWG